MDKLLTTQQAAEILGIGLETLKQARYTGTLFGRTCPEFIKLGHRTVRYNPESLQEWIATTPAYANTAAARLAHQEASRATTEAD